MVVRRMRTAAIIEDLWNKGGRVEWGPDENPRKGPVVTPTQLESTMADDDSNLMVIFDAEAKNRNWSEVVQNIKTYEPKHCAKLCPLAICTTQFRPASWQRQSSIQAYTESVSDAKAKACIQKHKESAEADQKHLRTVVKGNGNAIVEKWEKYNPGERRAIIEKALPDIAENRWLLVDHYFNDHLFTDMVKRRGRQRVARLLPVLTLEDLSSDSSRLLLLLHNRSEHDPFQAIRSDFIDFLRVNLTGSDVAFKYNALCFGITPFTYGKFQKFNVSRSHRYQSLGFPWAEAVFEAHTILYRFLRTIADLIVEDCQKVKAKKSKAKKKGKAKESRAEEEVEPKDGTDSSLVDLVNAHNDESTILDEVYGGFYAAPPRSSIEDIREWAEKRKRMAEDQLWVLQTDPTSVLIEIKERRPTEYYKNQDTDTMWVNIAFDMWHDHYARAKTWDRILVGCKAVKMASDLHDDDREDRTFSRAVNCSLGILFYRCQHAIWRTSELSFNDLFKKEPYFEKHLNSHPDKWFAHLKPKEKHNLDLKDHPDILHKILSPKNQDELLQHPVFWAAAELIWYPYPPCRIMKHSAASFFANWQSTTKPSELEKFDTSHIFEIFDDFTALTALAKRVEIRGDEFDEIPSADMYEMEDLVSEVCDGDNWEEDENYETSAFLVWFQDPWNSLGDCEGTVEELKEAGRELSRFAEVADFRTKQDERGYAKPNEKRLERSIAARESLREFWALVAEAQMRRLREANAGVKKSIIGASREYGIFRKVLDAEIGEFIVGEKQALKELKEENEKKKAALQDRKRPAEAVDEGSEQGTETRGRMPPSSPPRKVKLEALTREEKKKEKKAKQKAKKQAKKAEAANVQRPLPADDPAPIPADDLVPIPADDPVPIPADGPIPADEEEEEEEEEEELLQPPAADEVEPQQEQEPAHHHEPIPDDLSLRLIHVPPQSYEVLSRLWAESGNCSTTVLKFKSELMPALLTDTGLEEIRSGGGSSHTTLKDRVTKRRAQVVRPHGWRAKRGLGTIQLRVIGKQLRDGLGWGWGMFRKRE